MAEEDERLHTLEKAAEILSVGLTKLYELGNEGRIEMVKLGRATRVTNRSLQRYMAELLEHHRKGKDQRRVTTLPSKTPEP